MKGPAITRTVMFVAGYVFGSMFTPIAVVGKSLLFGVSAFVIILLAVHPWGEEHEEEFENGRIV